MKLFGSRRLICVAAAVLLVGAAAPSGPPTANQWEIGPFINGVNYSQGMPESPTAGKTGWSFQFPNPNIDAGHVHYLTYAHGPMTGKKRIFLRYRIDAKRDVKFLSRQYPEQPATISLYFQRAGDNWRAKGRYAYFRWYSPDAKMGAVKPGTHEITIALNDPDWISVLGKKSGDEPERLASAIANAERVGFVFGSSSARGHGVYATGAAKFILLDFRIE